jgi:transcription-repair coupling factor (superfamily II helicase)
MAALDLAADLLRLQATRDTNLGHAFSQDEKWQKEFEDAFPFNETVDQLKAINQVKEDMEKEQPMDRLVCGDVGFGKTEVALRAAFKAVMDGKQVAFLAPTTILCQQHLNLFRQRMADYPMAIEMLSRFRTAGQQKKIIQATEYGSVDILIGTHRMFSPDIIFKDLGLLIIDEEQRFGVQHKESIKKLRANVDVLTLSATPIPRTLYFAMVGARALSTIETAPVNRRPIRTEVMKNSPEIIQQAVQLEVRRGGQVFYLHNRVKTIHSVKKKLETQFPKLSVGIGHGQMSEGELEQVMTDFVAHRFDILVCTTIIESGLDIPNCNTIIIEGADKFGLSQLYQLRGRVGRFDKQAYAYLLLNRHLTVSDQARKRLSAIRQINNFGAGFRIALRDLELRGAGNLLGSEQSGHVAGIGFELYCRLLRESVSRLKGEEISLRPSATVRIDFLTAGAPCEEDQVDDQLILLGAYFPDAYTAEPRIRIEAYRKLAQMREEKEINDYLGELNDRFGSPPPEVDALIQETRIRCLAEEAGFDLLEIKNNEIFCRLIQRGEGGTKQYYRKGGKIPKLSAKDPLLKLKEVIRFLKIEIHGNQN